MFSKLEFAIAGRYLKQKKHDGVISVVAFLSIIGISIGVATLIIVLSIMNGFRADLMERILGINTHVSVFSQMKDFNDHEEVMKKLEGYPEVERIIPLVKGNAILSNPKFKDRAEGVEVNGMRISDFRENELLNNENFDGKLDLFEREDVPDGIILGYSLARKLNVYIGDEITLVTPQASSTVLGAIPRKKTFIVGGIFNVGMSLYDEHIAYVPLDMAQKLYGYRNGGIDSIGVMIEDIIQSPQFAKRLRDDLPTNYVLDWQEQNKSYFGAIKTERNMMFIVLTLIVLVASFNIISSMIMLTKEKSGSIAILRTMGLERKSIMRIFVIVGSINGISGTFFGVILGLLFCFNIESIQEFVEYLNGGTVFDSSVYYLSQVPAKIDVGEVVQVSVISLLISLLATLPPSWKAAKTNPAEALRYE